MNEIESLEKIRQETSKILDLFKAVHEAGHCIVAMASGWQTTGLKIISDGDGELGGYCQNIIPEDQDPNSLENFAIYMVASYAGNQAQRYYYKILIEPMEKEPGTEDIVADLRRLLLSGDKMDRANRNELFQYMPPNQRPGAQRLFRKSSRELVEKYFPLIYRVADYLLHNSDGLDSESLSELLNEYETAH